MLTLWLGQNNEANRSPETSHLESKRSAAMADLKQQQNPFVFFPQIPFTFLDPRYFVPSIKIYGC